MILGKAMIFDYTRIYNKVDAMPKKLTHLKRHQKTHLNISDKMHCKSAKK